jgi:hypothetical protein
VVYSRNNCRSRPSSRLPHQDFSRADFSAQSAFSSPSRTCFSDAQRYTSPAGSCSAASTGTSRATGIRESCSTGARESCSSYSTAFNKEKTTAASLLSSRMDTITPVSFSCLSIHVYVSVLCSRFVYSFL